MKRVGLAILFAAAVFEAPGARAATQCGGPGDYATCDQDPYRCPCDAYGRCGRSSCKVSRCTTDGDRATCGRNPRECPCDYFGNCDMPSCNSARASEAAPPSGASSSEPASPADTAARFGGVGTPLPTATAAPVPRRSASAPGAASRPSEPSASASPAVSRPTTVAAAGAEAASSRTGSRSVMCPHCGRVFTLEGEAASASSPASSPAPPRAAPDPSDDPVHPEARLTGRFCSTDNHRRACRENPAFCPCGYYHDCGMNSCRAPR